MGRRRKRTDVLQDSKRTLRRPLAASVHRTARALRVNVATQVTKKMVSVGTQVPHPSYTSSIGTQLSYRKLKHVRSKGTQATVSHFSVGTKTTPRVLGFPPSSRPAKGSASVPGARPAKRPCLDCFEEKEESMTPKSTCQPGESLTEPSQVSEITSTTRHNEPKYRVLESCLRELFQTCPLCKQHCDVQQQKPGTYVTFTQLCPNCQYTRRWQSQLIRGSTPVGNWQKSAASLN